MALGGAVAVIVYDNVVEGFVHMSDDGSVPAVTIPSVFITNTEGRYILDLLAKVLIKVMMS